MAIELKGVKKLDKEITNMVRLYICDDIRCKFSTQFCIDENKLYYSLFMDEEVDKYWREWLKDTYGNRFDDDFSLFVLTFLHEVGHYFTLDDFDDDEQDEYYAKSDDLIIDYALDSEKTIIKKHRAYWEQPVEKAATDWAIAFYNKNKKQMKNFYKDCMAFIGEFYRKNLAA